MAIEASPQNAPYIGQWERKQHELAIAYHNIAHFKIVLDNKIIGYTILIGITNPDRSIQLKRIVVEQKRYGFGRETIRLIKEMVFNKFQAHR